MGWRRERRLQPSVTSFSLPYIYFFIFRSCALSTELLRGRAGGVFTQTVRDVDVGIWSLVVMKGGVGSVFTGYLPSDGTLLIMPFVQANLSSCVVGVGGWFVFIWLMSLIREGGGGCCCCNNVVQIIKGLYGLEI